MPSKTPKQHRFMEAIAHSPSFAKKAGVSQTVGKDFAAADLKSGMTKTHLGKPIKKDAAAIKPVIKPNKPAPMLGVYRKPK